MPPIVVEIFRGFPESLQANFWTMPRLSHDCVLPEFFHFIIIRFRDDDNEIQEPANIQVMFTIPCS
jgi:hypothetical protein